MSAGPTGFTGMQGDQGFTGPVGIAGTVGIRGQQGPQGAFGTTGPRGPTGPIGLAVKPIMIQHIYGSTADVSVLGLPNVRTVNIGLPAFVGEASSTIPNFYMKELVVTSYGTVNYWQVPPGTYIIRAYATANHLLNTSFVTLSVINTTNPSVDNMIVSTLLTGTSVISSISQIADTYTFSATTNVVLTQSGTGSQTIPISSTGPNVGISFIKIQ